MLLNQPGTTARMCYVLAALTRHRTTPSAATGYLYIYKHRLVHALHLLLHEYRQLVMYSSTGAENTTSSGALLLDTEYCIRPPALTAPREHVALSVYA